MSLDAPAARWAHGGEEWREARQALDAPWGMPHPRVGRQCQVGGLGLQKVGLEEEVGAWSFLFMTYYCRTQSIDDLWLSAMTLYEFAQHVLDCYLSSCPAACHLARCCCPAGCRQSWRGRSPRAQMRCDWRQRKPSRRTPSPCAASSPDRRQRHNQLHGSVSPPGRAKNSEYNTHFKGHICT